MNPLITLNDLEQLHLTDGKTLVMLAKLRADIVELQRVARVLAEPSRCTQPNWSDAQDAALAYPEVAK